MSPSRSRSTKPLIVTVTPNPAVDRVLFLENFAWGRRIQVHRAVWGPGGKGTDGACVVAELGYPCLALGFAAGEPGERLAELLRAAGATPDFTPAGGMTRVNYVLVDTARGQQTTLTTDTLEVSPEQLAAFEARVDQALSRCSCLWLGGAMPSGVPDDLHARFIERARARGIPTILDARGPALRLGAAAHPTVLKPNEHELAELVGEVPEEPKRLADVLAGLLGDGTELVMATLGGRGAVAVTEEARWFLPPLRVPVVNAAGAGDGMAAALAIGLSQGWPWERSLRLAVATAAAIVMTPGTAECHKADVERLLPQVRLEPL
ncbi:MAG TPA: hexose kinase [Caldilineae bacterium]|nr:hexose kinase [Caldilineae bacterium]